MNQVPAAVPILWWIGIVVVVAFCVPALLLYLHRTLEAARTIRIYVRDTLEAAENMERNLSSAPMLADRLSALASPFPAPTGETQ